MKKYLLISAALNAALAAGLAWKEIGAHADSLDTPSCSRSIGDVNLDSRFDISDPVFLLNCLFLSGTCPQTLEKTTCVNEMNIQLGLCDLDLKHCQEELAKCTAPPGLPATDQTRCYDSEGIEIDCSDPDFPLQDGASRAGCPKAGRFKVNGDGTVTDGCTGLMWEQRMVNRTFTWQDALRYSSDLSLGDRTDWRLPNVRELLSIVDYQFFNPTVDPVFEFPAQGTVACWSSTSVESTVLGGPDSAWYVTYAIGNCGVKRKDQSLYVLAVRSVR